MRRTPQQIADRVLELYRAQRDHLAAGRHALARACAHEIDGLVEEFHHA